MPPLPACVKLKSQQTIALIWSRDSRFRIQKSFFQLIKSHDSETIQDIIAIIKLDLYTVVNTIVYKFQNISPRKTEDRP